MNPTWADILSELSKSIAPTYFDSFISPLQWIKQEANQITILAPTEIIKRHVETRYIGFIKDAAFHVLGDSFEVILLIDKKESSMQFGEKIEDKFNFDESSLNPNYTFESYIVSDSNRLAFTAAKSVLEKEGFYNPLYLFGPVGVGKTHLLHAIGNAILKKDPWKTVRYVDSISFLNEFIFTVRQNNRTALDSFKIKYQSYNVLLFDDVQFLNGSAEKTQEEFFGLFNYLYERKRQIVIASDRPSSELPIHDRLKSRFVHGLQADIKAHDKHLRSELLRTFSNQFNIPFSREILDWLADMCEGDARSLIGVINDLVLYKKAYQMFILSDEKIKEIASARFSLLKRKIVFTADQIIDCVCGHTNKPKNDVLGRSRKSDFIQSRHLCMYLLFDLLKMPKSQIGRIFNVNHTTVIHGIKKTEALLETDVEFQNLVNKIRSEMQFQ